MRMTIKQAIHVLHLPGDHLRNYDEYGIGIDDELQEAMQMAKVALREKAEREEPQPLTIEELKQMEGEPVYIYGVGWRINHGILHFMSSVFLYTGPTTSINITDLKGSIYRHKPKEDCV